MDEETTGQSRLFVILAIALIGLLVLGLLGIGGVFVIRQNLREQAEVSTASTPTLTIKLPDPTATPPPATKVVTASTAEPTPTNTPVVAAGAEAAVGSVEALKNVTNVDHVYQLYPRSFSSVPRLGQLQYLSDDT